MRELLDVLDANALLLMDESFSGTAAEEGAVIAGEVLKTVRDKGGVTFFSTHLHELASQSAVERFNRRGPCLKTLSADYLNGQRTFRIVEKEDDGMSYAYEIAEKYGLKYTGTDD
jgi:DNA mismatch repair ATPase MutS